MTYTVSGGALNSTHSLTCPLTRNAIDSGYYFLMMSRSREFFFSSFPGHFHSLAKREPSISATFKSYSPRLKTCRRLVNLRAHAKIEFVRQMRRLPLDENRTRRWHVRTICSRLPTESKDPATLAVQSAAEIAEIGTLSMRRISD